MNNYKVKGDPATTANGGTGSQDNVPDQGAGAA